MRLVIVSLRYFAVAKVFRTDVARQPADPGQYFLFYSAVQAVLAAADPPERLERRTSAGSSRPAESPTMRPSASIALRDDRQGKRGGKPDGSGPVQPPPDPLAGKLRHDHAFEPYRHRPACTADWTGGSR